MSAGGRAIRLIEHDPASGFKVGEEAREFLMRIKEDLVGVIVVSGKYRTGKSFLLNRILLR